jgi:hypothetical protein
MGEAARRTLMDWLRRGTLAPPRTDAEGAGLVDEAETQGLAGQLAAVALGDEAAWPAASVARLRRRQRELLARGVFQQRLGRTLLEALEGEGVPALPLKGLALTARLEVYGAESERPMSDLDLLVLGDFERAAGRVGRMGLGLEERADHAWRFREPDSRAAVELHHAVVSCPALHPLDREGLWARRQPGGSLPHVPAVEDLLVQLALHAAFQHSLRLTLVQWLDFRRLLERGRLDLDGVRRAAATSRAEGSLWAALSAAEAAVGALLPPSLLEWAGARTPRAARRWVKRRLGRPLDLAAPRVVSPLAARWSLSAGRRGLLLRETLAPSGPGVSRSRLGRAAHALRRAAGLARRWTARAHQ